MASKYYMTSVAGLLPIVVMPAGSGSTAAGSKGPAANAGWEEVGAGSAMGGGISNNGGSSSAPVPTIGPDGTTLITWHDNSDTNYEAYVRRWNGSAWVEVDAGSASGGGISNNAGNSYSPAPVIAPDGRAFIVWADATSGNYEINARSNPPVATTCYTLAVSVSVVPQYSLRATFTE